MDCPLKTEPRTRHGEPPGATLNFDHSLQLQQPDDVIVSHHKENDRDQG